MTERPYHQFYRTVYRYMCQGTSRPVFPLPRLLRFRALRTLTMPGVVGQNRPAAPKREQLVQIVDVILFVSVDEPNVDRFLEAPNRLVGVTFDNSHDLVDAGFPEMSSRRGCPAGIVLERGQLAARFLKGEAEPQAGETGRRTDFSNRSRRARAS